MFTDFRNFQSHNKLSCSLLKKTVLCYKHMRINSKHCNKIELIEIKLVYFENTAE